jgi:hypothetical protein
MAKQTFTTGQVLTAAQMTSLQQTAMLGGAASAKTNSYTLVAADAGTRISMNNAGATSITVNTSLFSAGDLVTIQNIGAGVCTITAGTATVTTAGSLALNQYEGGTLYFTSASAAIWFGSNPGDITAVNSGTGLSGGGTSGTVTLSIDTSVTADLTTAQTLTNKTLTAPVINLALNAQTGTTYTFALTDNGKLVTASNASTQTYSIPTNASVAFPTGTQINIIQIGAGQVTIQAVTSGTTTVASTGATAAAPKLRAQYSSATCIKVATDTWYVVGDIA